MVSLMEKQRHRLLKKKNIGIGPKKKCLSVEFSCWQTFYLQKEFALSRVADHQKWHSKAVVVSFCMWHSQCIYPSFLCFLRFLLCNCLIQHYIFFRSYARSRWTTASSKLASHVFYDYVGYSNGSALPNTTTRFERWCQ